MSVRRGDAALGISQAERAVEVIRLKRSGMTYDDIAAKTGVDRGTCWRWVRNALKTATAERTAEAEILRTEQAERLEALLAACWKQAENGSVAHIAEARRLIVALSDLYHLRQPIQFQWGVSDVERALAAVQRAIAERTAGTGSEPLVIEVESAGTEPAVAG